MREQLDLRERLVRQRVRHHERRIAGRSRGSRGASVILPPGKMMWSTCGLMFSHPVLARRRDVDFGIEVADVADNRVVTHRLDMD
jgi:hypothetical protein